MKKRLKINGIIMFLAFIVVMIFPAFFFRQEVTSFPFWNKVAKALGVIFILFGQLFRVSARGFKAENSKEGFALVETGPYSLVRNPMYLGIFLIGSGIVLFLFKFWVLVIFVVVFIIRYVTLIIKEEKKLIGFFPEIYPAYCKKVPRRIIPSLGSLLDKDISEYLPLKPAWIKKEIGSIVAILVIAFLFDSLLGIRRRGVVIYLKEASLVFWAALLFIYFIYYLTWRTGNKKNETTKR